MTTHLEAHLLVAYVRGEVAAPHAYSIEAHVVDCADCQAAIAQLVAPGRMWRTWEDIEDRLDAPRAGVVESMLGALGVSPHLARLLAATPSLSVSWLGAVALALAFAVVAAQQSQRGLLLFLCVAALLPLAGVAAAFGRGLDPACEVAIAAPFSGVRLVLLRASVVLPTTIAVAGLAALALPDVGWTAAAWLLPSLGLTALSLGLATFITPVRAFGTVTAGWLGLVMLGQLRPDDRLAAFGPGAQVAFAVLTAGAAVVLVVRRERLDVGSPT